MTIIEDSWEEMQAEQKESIDRYAYQGTQHEGDEFWHKQKDYPSNPTDTFNAVVTSQLTDRMMEEPGFNADVDISIRTTYSQVNEGDKLVYNGTDYVATAITRMHVGPSTYKYVIGAQQLS